MTILLGWLRALAAYLVATAKQVQATLRARRPLVAAALTVGCVVGALLLWGGLPRGLVVLALVEIALVAGWLAAVLVWLWWRGGS
jgi:hypothetical protein